MELGRLRKVEVRTVWESEARDFTPWLLDHHDHLAEALGIDLDIERSEHPVGNFSLDLVGRDLTNDAVLIVENQLGGTDHNHLGQILTYAAGTGASSIVWIATSFREEHRQAIDWLNEQTQENVRFFGIELQVVQIGESLPAPLFKLVAQPNDWQKQVRSATGTRIGSRVALYRSFWTAYLKLLTDSLRLPGCDGKIPEKVCRCGGHVPIRGSWRASRPAAAIRPVPGGSGTLGTCGSSNVSNETRRG